LVGVGLKMGVLKFLIMGLPASGKTTLVKHVFEKKKLEDMKEYNPTYGVNIALYNYKGKEEIKVSTFDCGGQTSFIDTYFTDQWVPMLFAEVSAFIFLVDSSDKKKLEDAGRLFRRYLENALKYSIDTTVYVLASKWDKHAIAMDQLKKEFVDTTVRPISVFDDSAKKTLGEIVIDSYEKKLALKGK
jgi:GTPase SAR1 family protein